jgi:hypothetical protein
MAKLIFYRALLVEDRKPRVNVYSFGHERSVAVHRLTVRIYFGPDVTLVVTGSFIRDVEQIICEMLCYRVGV